MPEPPCYADLYPYPLPPAALAEALLSVGEDQRGEILRRQAEAEARGQGRIL